MNFKNKYNLNAFFIALVITIVFDCMVQAECWPWTIFIRFNNPEHQYPRICNWGVGRNDRLPTPKPQEDVTLPSLDIPIRFAYPNEDNGPSPHEYHPTWVRRTTTTTTTLPPTTPRRTNIASQPPARQPNFDPSARRPNSDPSYRVPATNIYGNSHEKFNTKLQQTLATKFMNHNLIYSPLSLQALLALIYIGAEGTTAQQLQTALELPASMTDVQRQFQMTLSESQTAAGAASDLELVFASKFYFKNDLLLQRDIKETASNYFRSELAPISFNPPRDAVNEINTWVATKTHDRIHNIIAADGINSDTEAILINAIYMKAKWAREFSTSDTLPQDFYVDDVQQPIKVDMMYTEDDFKYGNFPELEASIVELPFANSSLSMLIILPHNTTGLANVEQHLRNHNLNDLLSRMQETPITVRLPKFSFETEIDMVEPLTELGVSELFSSRAQLGKMFVKNSNVRISKVLQKAFINVNEGGVEAAAASFAQIVPLSLTPNMIYFTADHPFLFAIRSPKAIYFAGHVIKNFNN